MMQAHKVDHSHTEPDTIVPDWDARDKGLKHAFNARGLNSNTTLIQNNVNFGELKDKYKREE
jgi:hypothetical protein